MTQGYFHGEVHHNTVALMPSPLDSQILATHERGRHITAIHFSRCSLSPGRNAQIERKRHVFFGLHLKGNSRVERIVGRFRKCDFRTSRSHLCTCFTAIEKYGSQTIIRSGKNQVVRIVRPSKTVVMLAATTAKRIHGEEGASVLNAGTMIFTVTLYHIGTGNVAQSAIIRHKSSGKTIKSHIFAILSPTGVTGD